MAAKPLVREIPTEGIHFFVWLDIRWIGSKPCGMEVYPEDMRFINSQLMCLGFLCMGNVSTQKCRMNLNGANRGDEKNHANSLFCTNTRVDVFMHGVICGRQWLGEG